MVVLLYVLHLCYTTVYGCSPVYAAPLLYDSVWLFYCMCCTFAIRQCMVVLLYVLHLCYMTVYGCSSVCAAHLLYDSVWLFYCMCCTFAILQCMAVLLMCCISAV